MNDKVEVPDHYDELDASLTVAWDLLRRGVRDRRLLTHTPTIATVDERGEPTIRTVVLRDWREDTRTLVFNSDRRAGKLEHLRRHATLAVHVYEPSEKIQLRMRCRASVHERDAFALQRWQTTASSSRICYHVMQEPGATLADPHHVDNDAITTQDGEANFSVVEATIEALEWLYLCAAGHRRARYSWSSDEFRSEWLVP
jgi:pyridoxine/pyridoxamine 5'-phosphate oxidase